LASGTKIKQDSVQRTVKEFYQMRQTWENATINRGRKEKAQTYLNPTDAESMADSRCLVLSPMRDLPPHMGGLDAEVEMLAPGKLRYILASA
jgi:hypothetical protein